MHPSMILETADTAIHLQELQTKEIKNARLAMVAFVGLACPIIPTEKANSCCVGP